MVCTIRMNDCSPFCETDSEMIVNIVSYFSRVKQTTQKENPTIDSVTVSAWFVTPGQSAQKGWV